MPPFSLRLQPSSADLPVMLNVQTAKMLPVWPSNWGMSRRGQVINYLHKMVIVVVQQCEETEKRAEDRNNESECPGDMGGHYRNAFGSKRGCVLAWQWP